MSELPESISKEIDEKIKPKVEEAIDIITKDRDSAEKIKQSIQYWAGEDRKRSAIMFENIVPTDEYPDGRILLHVDAILACANATSQSKHSFLIYEVLQAISFWYRFKNRGYEYILREKDRIKSKSDAKKGCKKLKNKGIIKEEPKDINTDNDAAVSYALWIKEWTGMSLEEYVNFISEELG